MSIFLRADNRAILTDGKTSYLIDNYSSGVSTFSVGNTEGIFSNSFINVGNIGSENTEILQAKNVDRNTGSITFLNFIDTSVSSTNAAATTIINFSTNRTFIAGQPVTIMVGDTGVSRGTGVVQTSGTGTAMTITNTGGTIINTVAGDQIVVSDITKFAHSESTKVTVVPYNKVRFFRTETPSVPNSVSSTIRFEEQANDITEVTVNTIDAPATTTYTRTGDPSFVQTVDVTPPIIFTGALTLTPFIDIQVSDFWTSFADNVNYDGYGWYAFYNTTTEKYSPLSNFIPYAGFADNTVSEIFASFDSELNTKEIKLISQKDRFTWINEANSMMVNELNLGNWEYNASEELELQLTNGRAEYLLPNNFSNLLFINTSNFDKVDHYSATFQRPYTSTIMKYMIRGKYLVFNPAPNVDMTVTISYLAKSSTITRVDQTIDLPDNCHYFLKDYMLYRAYRKLGNSAESAGRYAVFNQNIDKMKIFAIKRDNGCDSFSIAATANV